MSKKHVVYLAGQITGLTYAGCTDWRKYAATVLDSPTVETVSPLRGKEFLANRGIINSSAYDDKIVSSKGITRRDMFDTLRSSCVFVNLLGTKVASIGTCTEIAWCYREQIPVIAVMEKDNIHQKHVMISEACTYVAEDIDTGLDLVKWLLNVPGTKGNLV